MSRELLAQLRQLFGSGEDRLHRVVLVPADIAAARGIRDGDRYPDYNFGGEADMWVDIADEDSHFFFVANS